MVVVLMLVVLSFSWALLVLFEVLWIALLLLSADCTACLRRKCLMVRVVLFVTVNKGEVEVRRSGVAAHMTYGSPTGETTSSFQGYPLFRHTFTQDSKMVSGYSTNIILNSLQVASAASARCM